MAAIRRPFIWPMMFMLAWLAAPAHAHATLKSSTPADASVGPAPSHLTLEFSHPVRITSLTLSGERVAIAVTPLPKTAASRIELPAPRLPAGDYELAWRALGPDGHIMSGHFRFTIRSAAVP